MASPGMMQSGLSRDLFESWCGDSRNTCIIAGYCVEGTLAKQILAEPEEIMTLSGHKIPRKCQVDYISFSAHTDYLQTSEFIRVLRPPNIVLVHGEATEMNRLKNALNREYESEDNPPVIYNPKNTQPVELHFRGEKMAKVIGSLAETSPKPGHHISGVLVKRNFNYHLMDPKDMVKYTNLVISTVTQRLCCPFNGTFQDLLQTVTSFEADVLDGNRGTKAIRVFRTIIITQSRSSNIVTLEWPASPVNDMYADAVVAAIINKNELENIKMEDGIKPITGETLLTESIKEMFDVEVIKIDSNKCSFSVEGTDVEIDLKLKSVSLCEDETIKSMITKLLSCPSAKA
jgi:cleavage and polyadenylation specificity factor subunit 3